MRANAVYAKVVWYAYVFNMYVNKTIPQKQMHVIPIMTLALIETPSPWASDTGQF